MRKKDLIFYFLILILVVLFLWQWISKGTLTNQISQFKNYDQQLHILSGIGPLKSTHIHSDVKVYINGQSVDFSQRKYQLTTSFIHFEDGLEDVIHIHATGMTMSHLFKSIGMDFNNNCIKFEGENLCSDGNKKLKFYVNGQPNSEYAGYVMKDLDKILVSYGNENDSEMQAQLSSITNLAAKYSGK